MAGRRVLLTGAAGGIGSLVATLLKAQGADVTGVDRVDCPACDRTLIADLANEWQLAGLAVDLSERRVDTLVNLAGSQYFGPAEIQDPANIKAGYAINLIAPVTLVRAVLPQMRDRRQGQIVMIGSIMGSINYPYFATYSSAKAGLRGFSEALRRELYGRGIAVTYVAPRAARTAFNSVAVNQFISLMKMQTDTAEYVANRVVNAIVGRKSDVFIGRMENLFVRLNGVFPRVIDAGLSAQTVKARQLFDH